MKTISILAMVLMMFAFLSRPAAAGSAYDYEFKSIDGEVLKLSDFKGKTVLVVNTASRCGFTKQYEGLQKLNDEYKDQGFVILGVPSNDFGSQEPGTESEIKHFCTGVYRVTFPMTGKVVVSGGNAHPFYQWAAAQKKGGLI